MIEICILCFLLLFRYCKKLKKMIEFILKKSIYNITVEGKFKLENIYEELIKEIPMENIKRDEPMSKHTSFKIGGPADFFVRVQNINQLKRVIEIANENNIKYYIVGNGTNLLVLDKGVRGIVIRLDFNDIEINEKNEKVQMTLGAGVLLAKCAAVASNSGYTGFEFAGGIPGTIGGAVRMNAGAHGGEFKDIVIRTKYLDDKGKIIEIDNSKHEFEYRHSMFCNNQKYVILETTIELEKGNKEEIQSKMKEYLTYRKEKQPIDKPNAGSTFKRGDGFITAKLIDDSGLRGFSIGGAQVSEKHAGFVINKGNATAEDIMNLVNHIKKVVYEKFEKNIELEIEIIGE